MRAVYALGRLTLGMFDWVVFDKGHARPCESQRARFNSIIISIVSVIVFDVLIVLLAHVIIYDYIIIVPILVIIASLGVVAFLAAAAIIKWRNDDEISFLCLGVSLIVCVLLVLRPRMAVYQAELAKFVMTRGYYVDDVRRSGSALKVYSWYGGGGFSGAVFVDLVFDPRGTGEWTQELRNLAAGRAEAVPAYLTEDSCKHVLDVMFDHFYVVTTSCQS
ncbi:MAG: hypothetical protein P8Z80_01505 [Pseudolabrys sp.]